MATSSLIGGTSGGAWLPQFGGFHVHGPNAIDVTWGEPVNGPFHAEAHYSRVLGADFSYSATIFANWGVNGLSADLQISDL